MNKEIILLLAINVIIDMALFPRWGIKYDNKLFNLYRIFQWVLQLGITLYLYFYVDFKSALIFNMLIWYGWADILYYVFSDIFGLFILTKPVRTINWIKANETSWMNFTIIGIYNTLILKKSYSKNTIPSWQLILQAVIGIFVSIIIWKLF